MAEAIARPEVGEAGSTRRADLFFDELARGHEDRAQHRLRQLARERVLLARVVRRDQRRAVRETRERAVAERRTLGRRRPPQRFSRAQVILPADPAQRDDDLYLRQQPQLVEQEWLTPRELVR